MSKEGVVKIGNKEYTTVAKRVSDFWEWSEWNWSIETEIVSANDSIVVMRAKIRDGNGNVRSTGHAEERRDSSQINRTSALENAETSAIGRALAALGFGGTEFASANEVQNAIHQQKITPAAGAEDGLNQDQVERAKTLAASISDGGGAERGLLLWDSFTKDWEADQKVFAWSLLPSNVRSAIKKLQKEKQNGA